MLELEKKVDALPKNGGGGGGAAANQAVDITAYLLDTTNGVQKSYINKIGTSFFALQLMVQVPANAAQYGVLGSVPYTIWYPRYDLDFVATGVKADGSPVATTLRVSANGKIQYMDKPPVGVKLYGSATWVRK